MVPSVRKLISIFVTASLAILIGSVAAESAGMTIEGKIVLPKYTMIESLSTSLTLTDLHTKKQMHSSLKKDGSFEILVDKSLVGNYKNNGGLLILEVGSNAYMIDHPLVQLEVAYGDSIQDGNSTAVIKAYRYGLGETIEAGKEEKVELQYPLIMGALKKYNFYEQEKGFLAGTGQLGMMLNNKWIVGGIVALLLLLAFSYAIEQMDPETVERIKDMQQAKSGLAEPLIGSNNVPQQASKPINKKN